MTDDRIAMITDQVKYAVVKGGQNVTSQPFSAISQTPTSHVYNIAVPSLETIISREVFWETEVTLESPELTNQLMKLLLIMALLMPWHRFHCTIW